jgi:predicted amidohydrolase
LAPPNVKVGLVQLDVTSSKQENLQRIIAATETAGKNSDLLVFPEYSMGYPNGPLSRKYLENVAEPINGQFVSSIAEKSREAQIMIVIPIFEQQGGNIFNTAVIIDRGKILGGYRKVHLFDALGYRESDMFSRGSNPVLFRLGEVKIGVAICYDLRFPELIRTEVKSGARVILAPSAWFSGTLKEEQWQTLLTARALENTSYVVGVGNSNRAFVGRSMVVDPLVVKVLDLGAGYRIGFCEIDDEQITEAREKFPVMKQLADSAYGSCLQL